MLKNKIKMHKQGSFFFVYGLRPKASPNVWAAPLGKPSLLGLMRHASSLDWVESGELDQAF